MLKAGAKALPAEYECDDADPLFQLELNHGTWAPDALHAYRAMLSAAPTISPSLPQFVGPVALAKLIFEAGNHASGSDTPWEKETDDERRFHLAVSRHVLAALSQPSAAESETQ
jgi:hypothetical protein